MLKSHHIIIGFLVSLMVFCIEIRLSDAQGLEVLPIRPSYQWNYRDQVTTLLNKPYSPTTYASMSSYIYQLYGVQAVIDIESDEACRVNGRPCRSDKECCSKYCRCVKWSSMGKEICWRKCL